MQEIEDSETVQCSGRMTRIIHVMYSVYHERQLLAASRKYLM